MPDSKIRVFIRESRDTLKRDGANGDIMAVDDQDTEPTAVKTYVPAYQRDIWDEDADELDMSRSEFIRTMVQAGRRGFDPRGETPETGEESNPKESQNSSTGDRMASQVIKHLADGPLSWEELFSAVTDDVETKLEGTLRELQEENRVQYSGPDGGYVLVE